MLKLAAACAAGAVLIGCDAREPKPKVAFDLSPVTSAQAQQADRVVPPAAISGAMMPVDETFALFAASSGLAQVEGARMVLKSSKRAEVRDFVQKLARDHSQSLDELRRIVTSRGLQLPPMASGRHADMVTKLSGVAPQDLDEAFLRRFGVDAHKETISLYERHSSEGQDAALKKHAQAALATLREHLASAQKLVHASGSAR